LKQIPPSPGALRRPVAIGIAGAGALVLLGISSAVSGTTLLTPERQMFAHLPAEFPDWSADLIPMDPTVAEVLNADDTIVANIATDDAQYFNIYVAYLLERGDGRAWHSPRQCIPGGGWQIASHDVRKNAMSDGTIVNYNRLIIEHRNSRQVVYYWYDQRGRDIANEFVMKLWLIYDSLTRKRGDGALVRLIAPVTSEGGIAAADQLLLNAMSRIEPVLPKYVPE
jgi:EpsI family protein